jgi:hypothetical protein
MTAPLTPRRLAAALALGLAAVSCAFADGAPAYPPVTLGNTELRTLPRSSNGREYKLYVGLPWSYGKEPGKKYPVVYMCDAYWCFPREYAIRDLLMVDKVVPEYIIVGIGYAGDHLDYNTERLQELLPVPFGGSPTSGHADQFLGVIEKEIIPFVEREYSADPAHRVLGGSSFGGVFTLYAMFTKPELFWAYMAISPVVSVGEWPHAAAGAPKGWMFGYEDAFARSGRPLNTRLFMSVGSLEWKEQVESIRRFDEILSKRGYKGLSYAFDLVEGERHGGTNPEAETRGLEFLFDPLAPEHGQMKRLVATPKEPRLALSN